jgi:hypothetical protein
MWNIYYLYLTNIVLDRVNEILIAKRKIGASYNICLSPDTPCISQLDLVEKGRHIRCVLAINQQLKLAQEQNNIEIELENLLLQIPNLPQSDVPIGASEEQNIVAP